MLDAPLRIGIAGAGAIGCYLGGRLLNAGVDVVFFGRPSIHDEIARAGLTVVDLHDEKTMVRAEQVRFSTTPDILTDCSIIFVTVKCTHTDELARSIAAHLAPDSRIISFQNGVRNTEVLHNALPTRAISAGIVEFNVRSLGDGVFKQATSGLVHFEDREPSPLANLMRHAGFKVHTATALLAWQWSKLLLNLNNAINALAGIPIYDQLLSSEYRAITAAIMAEALDLLARAQIRPERLGPAPPSWLPKVLRMPTPLFRMLARAQIKVDRNARSSMWEDLYKHRLTEIDYLNGEVVRLAERLGAHAPLNRRLVALVHEAEARKSGSPAMSASALWAALNERSPA